MGTFANNILEKKRLFEDMHVQHLGMQYLRVEFSTKILKNWGITSRTEDLRHIIQNQHFYYKFFLVFLPNEKHSIFSNYGSLYIQLYITFWSLITLSSDEFPLLVYLHIYKVADISVHSYPHRQTWNFTAVWTCGIHRFSKMPLRSSRILPSSMVLLCSRLVLTKVG